MKFREHNSLNLPGVNREVLAQWEAEDLFHRSIKEREGSPRYVFYDGPPSANGHPGIHHVLARTIKDMFCRYKTMQGFQVPRKAGWDTHGLPVELGVEQELGITKVDIGRKISVEEYNRQCRKDVMKFTGEWEELTRQMGYWCDMENPYVTYDTSYIETLWWLLKQLHGKGLLYKGYTIQPYSPAAGTGLSSHELNLPGCYRDVKDTTVTAQLRILTPKPEMEGWGTPAFLAWTTTPWTLPSNIALCVGPKIDYVCVRTYNPYTGQRVSVVLARDLVEAYFQPEGATADLETYEKGKTLPYRIVGQWKGAELVGMRYAQLMPWVKPCMKADAHAPQYVLDYAARHPEKVFTGENGKDRFVEMAEEAFRVIPGDYVTTSEGTGIVHTAATFGADDARVSAAAHVPTLFLINKRGETRPMVDLQGKYYRLEELDSHFVEQCVDTAEYQRHAGDYVKNAYDPRFNPGGKWDREASEKADDLNVVICMEMKQAGEAFSIRKMVHSYPHCWRTDKPVLYYPLDSWFVRSTARKARMSELNETIQWKPASTGTGRFGKWLENLNDWNLSRSRYWGTPLPIWRNEDDEEICIGSLQELYDEIEKSVAAGYMERNPLHDAGFVPGDYSRENYERVDLHRPYVDNIVLVSPTGKPLHREEDLIDVWFDSGAMPYAQAHYPFENKEALDDRTIFPADFIAEGVDQTRGWFFTLHAIATMVSDSVAFKHVISNGLVLDKNGNKMSKRLGNAVDPFGAIAAYGSDPLRWYMITNSSPWDNLKFDEEGVKEVSRTFFGKLHQTYAFFAMYANVDGFNNPDVSVPRDEQPEIDRWMTSRLNSLVKAVTAALDDYEPTKAGRMISTFVTDDLSNWYVRLNRKRFWAGEMTTDKLSAYKTLYASLLTVSRLMAPIAPFFADQLYRDLTLPTGLDFPQSVHLDRFPTCDEAAVDSELELRMEMAQKITSMVLSLRKKEHIIVRQPLRKISIPATGRLRTAIEAVERLILDEVNVKELEFVEGAMLEKSVRCNYRVMGKKFGKRMKAVAAGVAALTQQDIATLEQQGSIDLQLADGSARVELADVEVVSRDIPGWTVANDGALTVALDLEITDELRQEGLAREVVKRVQTYRKEHGFEITDHINVVFSHNAALETAVGRFHDYICGQVLADSFQFADAADLADDTFDFDDDKVRVNISKS